jgi:hypothetical protein
VSEGLLLERLLEPQACERPVRGEGAEVSGRSSTTRPALAKGELRSEGDMPLTTVSPGPVEAGTMKPPGHMQNEKTPRPAAWWTRL